ncbi:MAG TPA: hypothetical protein VIL27_05260, partial [Clostridia bacterium]
IKAGPCLKGDKVTVSFPLRQVKTIEKAVDQLFEVTWRGDDVININPPGKYYPLYSNRKVFDKAPMKSGEYRRIENELYW